VFYALRPAVTGLIAVAGFAVFKISVLSLDTFNQTKSIFNLFNLKALILFIVLYVVTNKINKHPIIFIVAGALVGILIGL
ncbi:chromate transporter, partial [Turicibacter sanguinis]|nr:chromate transporter [Turicibacter sanguinis]